MRINTDERFPSVAARAFVFGGTGAGKSTVIQLCCSRPPRPGWAASGPTTNKTLLTDPLHDSWAIDLAFCEVPSAKTLGDIRRTTAVGHLDCAILVINVSDPFGLEATRQRAFWPRAIGIRCVTVLSVKLGDEVKISEKSVDDLAADLSSVQPAHFNVSNGSCQSLQFGMFLDVLAIRLAWNCWEGGVPSDPRLVKLHPALGEANSLNYPGCLDGATKVVSEAKHCGHSENGTCSSNYYSRKNTAPFVPNCAKVIPQRYVRTSLNRQGTLSRGRARHTASSPQLTPRGGATNGADQAAVASRADQIYTIGNPVHSASAPQLSPRLNGNAQEDLPVEKQSYAPAKVMQLGTLQNSSVSIPRASKRSSPPVREMVINLAALKPRENASQSQQLLQEANAAAPQDKASLRPPEFEVELDIGDGKLVAIIVHEGEHLFNVATQVVKDNMLDVHDLQRIACYLQQLRAEFQNVPFTTKGLP